MIEALITNERFRRIFAPAAAAGMIILFVSLGFWQLDRAAEKISLQSLFDADGPYTRLTVDTVFTDFQNIEAFGRYASERQVLIDNVFVDGRIGYYVITPFRHAADQPWLIVNRGWVAKPAAGEADADFSVGTADRTIRGRVGHLPRVGLRPGAPFETASKWPKKGIYPTLDDLSAELGRELLHFILLLSPADDAAYGRGWRPRGSGPMMHYGYAFQWFTMAAAVLGVVYWRVRKRRR